MMRSSSASGFCVGYPSRSAEEALRASMPSHKLWEATLSMADEFSPEVANENSPLRYGLVATVSAGRLDIGNVG